jgi:hypothetical protein
MSSGATLRVPWFIKKGGAPCAVSAARPGIVRFARPLEGERVLFDSATVLYHDRASS